MLAFAADKKMKSATYKPLWDSVTRAACGKIAPHTSPLPQVSPLWYIRSARMTVRSPISRVLDVCPDSLSSTVGIQLSDASSWLMASVIVFFTVTRISAYQARYQGECQTAGSSRAGNSLPLDLDSSVSIIGDCVPNMSRTARATLGPIGCLRSCASLSIASHWITTR